MKHIKILLNLLLLPFLFFGLFLTSTFLYAEGGGGGGGGGTPPSSNNPTVRITPSSKTIVEGNSGQRTVTVQVKIDKCPDTADIKIKVQTNNSSAKHNGDYIWKRQYITFSKGSCNKTQSFSVKVNGDTDPEKDEKFYIKIYDRNTDDSQDFTWGNRVTTVHITNDDENADLRMRKSANHDSYSKGDTVTYTLRARNLGPDASKIHVIDHLPSGLSFLSVTDNKSNFSCSQSGGTIECGGSRSFNKNQQVNITIKAKVTADGYHAITNTATVDSPNNIPDPNTNNNTGSVTVDTNIPGGVDDVNIVKTVNNTTPEVGDTVTFTITTTNLGLDKRIAMRDKFPIAGGAADNWGTTLGAFELVSYTKPGDVTCEEKTNNGHPYLFCYSNGDYTHNQSFTVTINAKVKKRGHICNRAHGYEYYWNWMDSSTVCMDATGNHPPVLAIDDFSQALFTSVNIHLSSYTSDADGDTSFTYSNISGLPPGLSMNSAGHISGTLTEDTSATYPKDYTVGVTVTDSDGLTGTGSFKFTVTIPDLFASDNGYSGNSGTDITGNFITDDTGNGVDSGWRIHWESCSNPTSGTVTCSPDGSFTYTPTIDSNLTDYFTYIISDNSGNTAQATVTLTFGDGGYTNQDVAFVRINPVDTWNIVGDYLVVGNTVQCVTQKTNAYDGTCQSGSGFYNNKYMTKYIDIDGNGDPSTWNSSSANFTMPDTYDNNDSKGVLWAGLFWQGSANNSYDYNTSAGIVNKQKRAEKNGATYSYKYVTSNENYDIPSSPAKDILIKIDNNATYTPVIANRLNYDQEHGSYGGYYAAFADVTALVQGSNLSKGDHKVTVANITSNEGREDDVGNYAGWSLVIIYKDDPLNDQSVPKNISIYQGFKVINGNGTIPTPGRTQKIPITGFRLPSEGEVKAKLSVFAGEGEQIYGSTASTYDKILLKRTDSSPEEEIPNIADPSNIFDAHLAGISRDAGNNNDILNANGVDVDDYNVSSVLKQFRDEDKNTNSLILKMVSNDDYVVINMIAFSAELYVPKLCYDYSLDIAGDVIRSTNNQIKTPFGGYGDDLTTVIYLKSLDGDIPLNDIDAKYSIVDTAQVHYVTSPCSTEISETGRYDYSDACPYTHDASSAGFGMYLGAGKSNSTGGTINPNEDYYIKFDTKFGGSDIDTNFHFKINYSVDFGSGKAELGKEFSEKDRCEPPNPGYNIPTPGFFNIVDISNPYNKWNLYTQTSRRAFNLKLFAYDATDSTLLIGNDLNLSVEIEMIGADNFDRDANVACNDEHSKLDDVPVKFVEFNENKGVAFGYAANDLNLAYKNVAMRIWYLTDVNGTGLLENDHNCTRNTQGACINLYKRDYIAGGSCSAECADSSVAGCYDCLRSFYGRKTCSRDNFAIRPESFVLEVLDSNESTDTTKPNNKIADSSTNTNNSFSLIAGYDYRFDINATNHIDNSATPRYKQHFSPGDTTHYVRMKENFGSKKPFCNDTEDQNISLNLYNGSSVNTHSHIAYVDKVDQIGEYQLVAYDENWTSADSDGDQLSHHGHPTDPNKPDYSGYFLSGTDCNTGDSTVPTENPFVGGKITGCAISSVHTNVDTGTVYNYLNAQYYPYTFDLTNLTIGAGPKNDKNFVYINTLATALYPNGQDENMSYNIQGTFTAVGRDGVTPTSNFVDQCYAESVDMNPSAYYPTLALSQKNGSNGVMMADVIDHSTVTAGALTVGDVIRTREQPTLTTNTLTGTAISRFTVAQASQYFKKDMNASLDMDLGFNFARQNNVPLNPRKVTMKDFNVSYTTPPATIWVDMKSNYKIVGTQNIDKNVTFMYARAKPAQSYYETAQNNINTPVSVVVYCDSILVGYAGCRDRGIDVLNGQTNEANWWKSVKHNNVPGKDGNIELLSAPVGALNQTTVLITSAGEDDSIDVSNTTGTIPAIIPVTLKMYTNPFANYTDRWLIYNPESRAVSATDVKNKTATNPFYRVKFLGASGWAGHGKAGHVVGGQSNTETNKRLEW